MIITMITTTSGKQTQRNQHINDKHTQNITEHKPSKNTIATLAKTIDGQTYINQQYMVV